MNTRRAIAAFAAAAALVAGAVLLGEDNAPSAAPTGADTTAMRAPAWKLKDLDGHEVSSDQFKGKVVVLDFWATWCGPCVEEIPGYIALQKKYGAAGLVVVGVSMDRAGPARVKPFVQAHGMNYTIVMGEDETVEAFGNFSAIPTTFLISRDGRILNQKTGAVAPEEYEKLVKSALN